MNDNAKKWVEALESGRFKQAARTLTKLANYLEENDRHCCLGVACVIYQEEVGDLVIERTNGNIRYDGSTAILPPKVQIWLGLSDEQGSYDPDSEGINKDALTNNNDQGADFVQIAQIIRSEPEGLFASA